MKKILQKIKWLIAELIKINSSRDSFFSQKRLFNTIAFITYIFGSVFYIVKKGEKMNESEFLIWGGLLITASGLQAYFTQSQKFKFMNQEDKTDKNNESI